MNRQIAIAIIVGTLLVFVLGIVVLGSGETPRLLTELLRPFVGF